MVKKKTKEVDGKKKEQSGSDTTNKLRRYDERSRPIPFFLAAVSVCDIQAFTENRFAKKGGRQKIKRQTERQSHQGNPKARHAVLKKQNFKQISHCKMKKFKSL